MRDGLHLAISWPEAADAGLEAELEADPLVVEELDELHAARAARAAAASGSTSLHGVFISSSH